MPLIPVPARNSCFVCRWCAHTLRGRMGCQKYNNSALSEIVDEVSTTEAFDRRAVRTHSTTVPITQIFRFLLYRLNAMISEGQNSGSDTIGKYCSNTGKHHSFVADAIDFLRST